MKISKLFHWLYGLVMLLPIFAIGVTCGYAMFNKNAYQSFETNEKELIQVEYTDLTYGKNYDFEINSSSSWTNAITYVVENFSYVTYTGNYIEANNYKRIRLYSNTQIVCRDLSDNVLYLNVGGLSKLSFTYYSYNEDTGFIPNFNIYEENYKNSTNIQNVFYYAVDKVTQSNLFSWSYDSFLVTPFAYIVNLFSMPTNSPVVMLLSYWLTISIIWLVFDLIMYVPLLAHRWLDKGMVE